MVIVTSPRFVIVAVPATSPDKVITGSLLSVTLPFVTAKSVELNEAIPLLVVLASSPEIVIVVIAALSVTIASIPSPPTTFS